MAKTLESCRSVYVGKYVSRLSSHESRRLTYNKYFQVVAEVYLFGYHEKIMLPRARALAIVAAWGTGGQIASCSSKSPSIPICRPGRSRKACDETMLA